MRTDIHARTHTDTQTQTHTNKHIYIYTQIYNALPHTLMLAFCN